MTAEKFDVVIVGGGIAGMTAAIACREKGFNVTLLEGQPEFTSVGAGLMISSNATRPLCEMGMRQPLDLVGIHMRRVCFLKHDDGTILDEKTYYDAEERLGAPLWQIHRGDLHDVLLAKAKEWGTEIMMGAKVKTYDPETPSVLLEDGRTIKADMIIAADGYRSLARGQMLGQHLEPRPSGQSAFRAVLERRDVEDDSTLLAMMDTKEATTLTWIGNGCHALCYPIRQGEGMNLVLNQPPLHTIGSKFVVQADPAEIAEIYKGWDPRLTGIIQRLRKGNVLEWKLCDLDPLESWIFPGGKIALMGDACHPMLPSAAQGAGMGIEDGVAIAELLARAHSRDQIPAILRAYQELRLTRCSYVVDTGRQNSKKWHEKENVKGGTVTDDIWDYDIRGAARAIHLET